LGSDPNFPIGVFDSGVGGLSVLKALRTELPGEDFVYFADDAFAPYGERGDDYVIQRSRAVVQQLRGEHAIKALVIACNTATAAAIHLLRAEHAGLPMVGVEPALKPAATHSKTRRIGVLATRGTLASAKFRSLRDSLSGDAEFLLQPCDGLADAIQNNDPTRIAALCAEYTSALAPYGALPGQVDTLVLGCTHYPFASSVLTALLGPQVRLIETGAPVARQTRRLLENAGQLQSRSDGGSLCLLASGPGAALHELVRRWL
jgi:glutamate racemase